MYGALPPFVRLFCYNEPKGESSRRCESAALQRPHHTLPLVDAGGLGSATLPFASSSGAVVPRSASDARRSLLQLSPSAMAGTLMADGLSMTKARRHAAVSAASCEFPPLLCVAQPVV